MNKKVKPIIRWAGSKRRVLNTLRENCPEEFGRYIEPFCGSIVLHLALKPRKALVGDINQELINFYNQVKAHPVSISQQLHNMPRTKETYYEIRSQDIGKLNERERAVRFFFLNRHCFNGVYRTNKAGKFNVPFGSKLAELPVEEDIVAFSKAINNTEFRVSDFQSLVNETVEKDFIYLDPPYAEGSKDRGEYGVDSFKKIDIDRLKSSLDRASGRGVNILLSYADTEEIREKFSNWNIKAFNVGRSVSGFARGRKKVSEVIISNYRV